MAKTLVIAEKPSVGQDLARVLPGPFEKHTGAGERTNRWLEGPEHIVTWAVGHLVQLAEPDEYDDKYKKWRMADLPIVPRHFKLVVRDERSQKQMAVVRNLLKRDDVDRIVNACDAGREGELIFKWVLEQAGGTENPVERLWLASMTKQAMLEALAHLRPDEEMKQLEQAAKSRSEADWIVGMNAPRAATIRLRSSFGGAVSLGRVQTPTLAILSRREEEIRAFVPEKYWLAGPPFAPHHAPPNARATPPRRPPIRRALPRGRPAPAEDGGGGRRDRRRRPRQARRDHEAREVQAHGARAAPVRPHLAPARGEHALRLLGAPHAGGRAALLRGAQGPHLSAHELALPDERHGRRDQADRRAGRQRRARVRAGREVRHVARPAAARARRRRRQGRRPPRDHPDELAALAEQAQQRRPADLRPRRAPLPRRLPPGRGLREHARG